MKTHPQMPKKEKDTTHGKDTTYSLEAIFHLPQLAHHIHGIRLPRHLLHLGVLFGKEV